MRVFVSEYPSAVIFAFKNDDSVRTDHQYVDLGGFSVFGGNIHVKQEFCAFFPVTGKYLGSEIFAVFSEIVCNFGVFLNGCGTVKAFVEFVPFPHFDSEPCQKCGKDHAEYEKKKRHIQRKQCGNIHNFYILFFSILARLLRIFK